MAKKKSKKSTGAASASNAAKGLPSVGDPAVKETEVGASEATSPTMASTEEPRTEATPGPAPTTGKLDSIEESAERKSPSITSPPTDEQSPSVDGSQRAPAGLIDEKSTDSLRKPEETATTVEIADKIVDEIMEGTPESSKEPTEEATISESTTPEKQAPGKTAPVTGSGVDLAGKNNTSGSNGSHVELTRLQEALEAAEAERDDIQDQYDDLLAKVSQIRATLGQRLKSDAAELAEMREKNESLQGTVERLQRQVAELRGEQEARKVQWQAERAEMQRELTAKASSELELGEQRSLRDALEAQVAHLSEELASQTNYAQHYKQTAAAAATQHAAAVADLERGQRDAAAARDAAQSELASVRKDLEERDAQLSEARAEAAANKETASTVADLQAQVKEKNIAVGKLRHEAVILNEHLTNALRQVKKSSEGTTVDKELISNLFVQYTAIPRGDTKKFEVLQLISTVLGWDEERQAQVGLIRGGPAPAAAAPSSGERLGGFVGKFAEFLERESRKR